MKRKERLSASVDADLIAAAERAVADGRADNVSSWVNDALRLRDYARIDLRVSDDGEIFVIEVNPDCYLERSGEFARAAEKAGFGHDALIGRIVELAAGRYAR